MKPLSTEEPGLLRHLKAGDPAAFARLYDLYSPALYANLRRIVKDEETAKELLQDTFLKLWQQRETIDITVSFKAYLLTAGSRMALNHFRRGKVHQRLLDYLSATTTELHDPVSEATDFRETEERLRDAIAQLPSQRKLVYTLCKLEGKSYEEVGRHLNISTSTISDHIVKATRFIKSRYYLKDSIIAMCSVLLLF